MSTEFERIQVRLLKFTGIMSVLMFFIPLVLIIVNGGIRTSVSDFAYMEHSEWYCVLITMAGAIFIMDGTIWNKRWYNIILGCSLVGVALTPYKMSPLINIIHNSLAGIFFIGSVFVMILYSSAYQRPLKVILGGVIVVAMTLHYVFPVYGLFWAEWIGMLPITLHFLGEGFNKLD